MTGWRYEDEKGLFPAKELMDPVIMIRPPAFMVAFDTQDP